MSEFYGLVVRWLFVSRKGTKMQFLGVVGLKSSTLTVYCFSSWFIHQQRKHIQICVSFVDSFIFHDFRDLSIFHPLFGPKSKIITLSPKFQKSDFLGNCSFTQLFHDVEKLSRKPKIFVKVIQRFWWAEYFKKSTRSSQSCNFGKIFQCWKNLGMFPSSRFWDIIFFNSV